MTSKQVLSLLATPGLDIILHYAIAKEELLIGVIHKKESATFYANGTPYSFHGEFSANKNSYKCFRLLEEAVDEAKYQSRKRREKVEKLTKKFLGIF